ncbi:MAG: O-antigen ligase family protein [Clostridia bacterium]|nr:O-antigen ligase family protein [Clostridia bacterium]
MEAKRSYSTKNNNFTFAVDRLYDVALLFLMCIITAHNSRDEGRHYVYYAAFFIFLAVATLRAVLRRYLNFSRFRIPMHTLWYGVFILLCLMSILWARYPERVMMIMSKMVQNLAISYFLILNIETKQDFRRTENIFILSVIYLGLKIFFSVPTSQLFSRHLGGYEITGNNVNNIAISFALMIIILFYRFYSEKNTLMAVPIVFLGFMLMLTSSRKSVSLVALAVFLIILFDRKRKHKFLNIFLAVFVVGLVAYLIFTDEHLYKAIGWKFSAMFNFLENDKGDTSLYERRLFRKYAFELFCQHPILGVGAHNFSGYLRNIFSRSTYSHNNWLEMLSCLGIVGFIAYYWFYIYLLVKLARQYKKGVNFTTPFLVIVMCMLAIEYIMVVYLETFIQLVITLSFISLCVSQSETNNKRIMDMGGHRIGKQ